MAENKVTSIEIQIPDDPPMTVPDPKALKAALVAEAKKHILSHPSGGHPTVGPEDKFRVSLKIEPL